MYNLAWLETHIGSLENTLVIINEFNWELLIDSKNERMLIGINEEYSLSSVSTNDQINCFLYGMALAYVAGAPEYIHSKMLERMKDTSVSEKILWLNRRIKNVEDAVKVANDYYWKIIITNTKDNWTYVSSSRNENVIFSSDVSGCTSSFLYGLGTAYAGFPDPYYEYFCEELKEWFDTL